MKRLCWMGWIGTVLLGIGLHALYTWRPIPLLGLFSPVNESVWEHLKLLYWPFLAVCGYCLLGYRRFPLFGARLAAAY